jgi:hypothetical protein
MGLLALLEKQLERAAQVQLTCSSTSFALDTDVDAGSRNRSSAPRSQGNWGSRAHWRRLRFPWTPTVHLIVRRDTALLNWREFSVSAFPFFRLLGVGHIPIAVASRSQSRGEPDSSGIIPKIGLASQEGAGSRFYFDLPLTPTQAAVAAPARRNFVGVRV